jgi:predicted transcriptional regulator
MYIEEGMKTQRGYRMRKRACNIKFDIDLLRVLDEIARRTGRRKSELERKATEQKIIGWK